MAPGWAVPEYKSFLSFVQGRERGEGRGGEGKKLFMSSVIGCCCQMSDYGDHLG